MTSHHTRAKEEKMVNDRAGDNPRAKIVCCGYEFQERADGSEFLCRIGDVRISLSRRKDGWDAWIGFERRAMISVTNHASATGAISTVLQNARDQAKHLEKVLDQVGASASE